MGFICFPGGIFLQILFLTQLIWKRLVFCSSWAQEWSSQGALGSPRRFFCTQKHLWFLSDLNRDLGGDRKHPGKPQRRFAARQTPVPQSGGANSPNLPVGLCKKAASKAKRRGDLRGRCSGAWGRTCGNATKVPKNASLHSEPEPG